jgi:2-amino-4-hydroxy-6-hydroxymethyldihydropteridine diphosphokinase
MTEHIAYIGLGSNGGDSKANFKKALSGLDDHPKISLVKTSSFYKTSSLGPKEQPDFLNAVAQIHTSIPSDKLLQLLHLIERNMGRKRTQHWGPRVIDLDLLLYGQMIINEPDLIVPHPQMHLRSFVLKGLCELDKNVVHPVLKRTSQELYMRLSDADYYLDDQKPQLISIAGNIGVGKTTLATGLAQRLNAKLISEKYNDNPYLSDVYGGKTELALDSELFFLASGASQLRKDQVFASRRYISDYVFDKALIYASGWLNENDLEIYRKHYQSVREGVADPVVVIYLKDSIENCLQRIHRRNRPYEQEIQPAFLEHLAQGYDTLYNKYTICPVVQICSDECSLPEQVDRIANEIQHYLTE